MREATLASETLKSMIGTKPMKAGHFIIEFVTPGIGHMLKNAGCDFVVFDMEHSAFGYETIKQALRYAEAAQLPAIVRTPSRDYHHIARACDSGAEGIMLPMVGSAAEAKGILQSIKYYGEGMRGVALGVAHDNYRAGPTADKLLAANRRTTVFMQIETAEGVENAAAIAALDGVDCLWIGHFDLSCSLGIPGQFDHPTFIAAVATVTKAAHKHGKSLGRLVPDVATGLALHRAGFDFISYAGDVWVYQAAVAAGIAGLREGAAVAEPAPARAGRRAKA
jgi:2-dehydro-3-deoxyglucarate aldolase/4-hydroxy-2-oxoheptanedioate aldolase